MAIAMTYSGMRSAFFDRNASIADNDGCEERRMRRRGGCKLLPFLWARQGVIRHSLVFFLFLGALGTACIANFLAVFDSTFAILVLGS